MSLLQRFGNRNQLDSVRLELAQAQAESETLQSQIDHLTREVTLARTECSDQATELQTLRAQVAELSCELEAMEAEKSQRSRLADTSLDEVSGQLVTAMAEAEDGVGILIKTFSDLAKTSRELCSRTNSALTGNDSSVTTSAAAATETMDRFVDQMLATARGIEDTSVDMRGLVEVTSQLSGLLKEIEAIASQTGLLALNASLEAARAGEAGLGFSVVASQVRNLAERARKSSEQTRHLTAAISTKSTSVSQRLGETAKSSREGGLSAQQELGSLMESIREADAQNREAVSVISEQASAVDEEISRSIVAFQFHDLMRQRLQHALAPLNSLREVLTGNCPLSQLANAVGAPPDLHVVRYEKSADDDVTLF